MIEDLKERLEEIARSGPGLSPGQTALVREEIEELDRSPFLLQLAYAESVYDRFDELSA